MTEETKKIEGAGSPILKPIDVGMERLFVAPEKNDTTRIAALMAKCVAPVRLGVLGVPKKVLEHIDEKGRNSETILPIEAVEVYRTVWLLENRMLRPAAGVNSEDVVEVFTYDAMQSAETLVDRFTVAIAEFCGEIAKIREQVASEKSFFMAQTLGTEVAVDPTLIVTAAQNFIQSLNVLASGLDGYIILALARTVDSVGKLLDDPRIQKMHGAPNQTALVNKLGFRILPGHVALHNNMSGLLELMLRIEDGVELEKDELVKVFSTAEQVEKGLEQFGGAVRVAAPDPVAPPTPRIPRPTETPRLESRPETSAPITRDAKTRAEAIGRNVLIKEPRDGGGIGRIVDILPENTIVAPDKLARYFGEAALKDPDACKKSDKLRVVIEKETGIYIVVPVDGSFEKRVTVI